MSFESNPQLFMVCPNLILMNEGKVLLLRRADWAPLFPRHWHCVTGKIESGETAKQTIIRETAEEVGLNINPTLGTVISVTAKSYQNPGLIWRDLSLFFVDHDFEGEPVNMEPRLHDVMDWFDANNLPEPIIPVVRCGIEHYVHGKSYGEFSDV
jgi:8-oxo-dGTP pyrophosphatase MutT (NUDIX family)